MGAGNPLLRSFDPDRFMPTTYYVDLVGGVDPDEYAEMAFGDFVGNTCASCDLEPLSPYDRRNMYDGLSSAFRQSGVTIAEGKRCYLITETGSDYSHLPFAVVPNFRWEDLDGEPDAEAQWERAMQEFRDEARAVLKSIVETYGDSVTQRAGAWTSGPVGEPVTP